MQREKIQLIRDGLETAYVNGNTASELLYKPNFVSNNHNEDTKTYRKIPIGTIPPSPIVKYPN